MAKNWPPEETLKLIARYEEHENLWNVHCEDYKDRAKRNSSFKLLSEEFSTTVEEINRKIRNLRSQHAAEQKRFLEKKNAANENHFIKWPFFAAMNFLVGVTNTRSTSSNMQDDLEDEEDSLNSETTDLADDKPGCSISHPLKRKIPGKTLPVKRPCTVPDVLLLDKATENLSEPEDEFSTFGKFVASEMRGFRLDDSRRRLKIGVQRLLLDIAEQENQAHQWQNDSNPITPQQTTSAQQWPQYNYTSYSGNPNQTFQSPKVTVSVSFADNPRPPP